MCTVFVDPMYDCTVGSPASGLAAAGLAIPYVYTDRLQLQQVTHRSQQRAIDTQYTDNKYTNRSYCLLQEII